VVRVISEQFSSIIETSGSEALWPYFFAGTMGLVQRDGLERFRRAIGASQMHATFCTTLPEAGWVAGAGKRWGSDVRLMEKSELVVIWGGNPVNTQVNVMNYIAKARRASNAKVVVVDPYRTRTADKADEIIWRIVTIWHSTQMCQSNWRRTCSLALLNGHLQSPV